MTINVYEVVKKLTGEIDPVGETHVDNKRYENLQQLTALTEQLLTDICSIENRYKNNHQYSMKRASEHCARFLDDNGVHE